MKSMLRAAAKAALKVTKRFLTNQPANGYERIAFTAVRQAATYFGTGKAATA